MTNLQSSVRTKCFTINADKLKRWFVVVFGKLFWSQVLSDVKGDIA